jgi:hypothetical protein
MSTATSIPYYTRMFIPEIIMEVSEFLGFKETLLTLSCIDRTHRYLFSESSSEGLPFFRIEISNKVVRDFFSQVGRFKHLKTLLIQGDVSQVFDISTSQAGIENLAIIGDLNPVPVWFISTVIQALQSLRSLELAYLSGHSNFSHPEYGQGLANQALESLESLTHLSLIHASIPSNGLIKILQHTPQLTSLILYDQLTTNTLLQEIKDHSSITHLELTACKKGGAEDIDLEGEIQEAENDFSILAELKQLEIFIPDHLMTADQVIEIIRSNPKITLLDLRQMAIAEVDEEMINDEVLHAIGEFLPGLKVIKLYSCKNISCEAISSLFDSCKDLEGFYASNIPQNVATAFTSLHYCSKIDTIEIHYTNLSDLHLTSIASLKQLRRLDLSECTGFSADCLNGIESMESLTHLGWFYPGILSAAMLGQIIEWCPALEYLNISVCEQVEPNFHLPLCMAITEKRCSLKVLQTDLTEAERAALSLDLPDLKIRGLFEL